MKKYYYLLFYEIYKFFKSTSDHGWSAWKAFVIISCAQALLIVEIDVWCDIIFREKNIQFLNTYIIVIPLSIILAVVNYYPLLYNEHWRQYEDEFNSYSKQKRSLIGLFVFLFLTVIVMGLIFAFYQMSLIDWSKYRHLK